MSRELRFRAVIPESNAVILFGLNDLLENKFSNRELLWPWLAAKNIPDQFTGLKDKNGVEIYEGDIVRNEDCFGCVSSWGDATDESPDMRLVVWSDEQSRFDWAYLSESIRDRGCSGYTFCAANGKHVEVIGNIHEHPELLEAK